MLDVSVDQPVTVATFDICSTHTNTQKHRNKVAITSVQYSKKHRQLLVQIGHVENGQPSLQSNLQPRFFNATDFDYTIAFGTERYLVP